MEDHPKEWKVSSDKYYMDLDPFRFVKRYVFTFRANAKTRWCGKTIQEVAESEFSGYS